MKAVPATFFLALPIAIWTMDSWLGTGWLYPPAEHFIVSAPEIFSLEFLQEAFVPSFLRIVAGIIIGGIVGLAGGLLVGSNEITFFALSPLAVLIRSTPAVVLIPVSLALFGFNEVSSIAVVVVSVGSQLAILTMVAVRNTPAGFLRAAHSMNFSPLKTYFVVRIPAAKSALASAFQVGVQSAVLVTITTEALAGGDGLGSKLFESFETMRVAQAILILFQIGVLSAFFSALVTILRQRSDS